MNKVILDDALRAKLDGLASGLELCDEAGRTVGHVVPPDLHRDMFVVWARAQITEKELEAARNEPGGRPLAEIWRSLGQP